MQQANQESKDLQAFLRSNLEVSSNIQETKKSDNPHSNFPLGTHTIKIVTRGFPSNLHKQGKLKDIVTAINTVWKSRVQAFSLSIIF